MTVSMNGLRKNMAEAYKTAVRGYREATDENGYDDSFRELKEGLDQLRSVIGGLLACYEPGDPDFIELEIDLPCADPEDEDE